MSKSKSSRMERLGYQMLQHQLWICIIGRFYRTNEHQQQHIIISRSIRPVPHQATLVTKPPFIVAAAYLDARLAPTRVSKPITGPKLSCNPHILPSLFSPTTSLTTLRMRVRKFPIFDVSMTLRTGFADDDFVV